MEELYQQIIDKYHETRSVKKTAEALGTYPIKVRRVLITEGLWHSKTSDRIMELSDQGMTVAQIAEKLVISEKNVQSYMPYTRGQYGGSNRSDEAIRSEEYRDRMHKAAQKQVTKTEAKFSKQQSELEGQRRLLEELKREKERLLKEKREMWNRIEAQMKRIPMAMQLHLELDMEYVSDEEIEVLQKYGRMDNTISRDFIVPGNITLHGLHYAIMKAFGWQNSHLHSYRPYPEEFDQMTDGSKVKEWNRLVGMYFRFPSDDYEDIYWDDDYEESMSFKSWLKSKYCGPYVYYGTSEHYLAAQKEVEWFKRKYPEIQSKSTDQREWGVLFDGFCEEMIERPMLWTVLRTPDEELDWSVWRREKESALKIVEPHLKAALKKYQKLDRQLENIAERARQYFDETGQLSDKAIPYIREMERLDEELGRLFTDNDPEPVPALSALRYCYDYGDGWEIKITCTNAWYDRSIYERDEEGELLRDRNGFIQEEALYLDAFKNEVFGNFLDQLKEIQKKEKPVCIAADGMNLVDDVGGIGGFCEFLEIINGKDTEKKRQYKEWARGLGWTGRFSKPENIL